MHRTTYHVTPHHDPEGWQVKLEGAERASSLHDTKEEAVAEAKRLAKDRVPSQVIVHGADGRMQEEFTYGDDPESSRG